MPARQTRRIRKKIPEAPKPTQWPRGSIVYICGEGPVQFGPHDKNLGGSETAVVELSKCWVARGHPVVVYGNVKECKSHGVEYRDIQKLNLADKFDVAIFWRSFGIRFLPVIDARLRVLDLHDSWDPKQYVNPKMLLDKSDLVMVKSNYHKSLYDYIPKSLMKLIMNGIKLNVFESIANSTPESKRHPFRIIYASSYERGLEPTLKYTWPLIKKAIPEAEFHIYYGMNRLAKEPLGKRLFQLFKQPGVFEHGRVSHEEVAEQKCKSAIHLYLSNSSTEIDCISVRESLICGAVPVLGRDYVFKERDGIHVSGSTDDESTYRKAAQVVIRLLKDQEKLTNAREKLHDSKTIVGWDTIADKWLDYF